MEHEEYVRTAQALTVAIRNITEEVPDGQPLGPAEQQIENILALLDPKAWPADLPAAAVSARLGQLSDYMAKLCEALADDTKLLREAAEGFWPGHDFRRGLRNTIPADTLPL